MIQGVVTGGCFTLCTVMSKHSNTAKLTWLILFNGINAKIGIALHVLCQSMSGLNNKYLSFLSDS